MKKKSCPNCEKAKKLSEFGKDKNRDDGLQIYCLECKRVKNAEYDKKHKLALANMEKQPRMTDDPDYHKKWLAEHPGYTVEWNEKNREHLRAYRKAYRKRKSQL